MMFDLCKQFTPYISASFALLCQLHLTFQKILQVAIDAEVIATAGLLSCDIVIYSKFDSSLQWQRYPSSFSLKTNSEYALYLENVSDHFNVEISV